MFLTYAHSVGGVVSVRCCITKENSHFVHRYRLDLLPSTHPHQQLMELQLMSVSAEEGISNTEISF